MFLGIPRSRFAGPYVNSAFKEHHSFEEVLNCLPKGLQGFPFPLTVYEALNFSTSLPTLGIMWLFGYSYPSVYERVSLWFIVLGLISRYIIHFELVFYMVWGKDPTSFFFMWWSSCPRTILWRNYSSPYSLLRCSSKLLQLSLFMGPECWSWTPGKREALGWAGPHPSETPLRKMEESLPGMCKMECIEDWGPGSEVTVSRCSLLWLSVLICSPLPVGISHVIPTEGVLFESK